MKMVVRCIQCGDGFQVDADREDIQEVCLDHVENNQDHRLSQQIVYDPPVS